jgi:hypothetical protein
MTAVDVCPDALQIRLESSRPDVVGVAQGPADDRGLTANLATLGHGGCDPSSYIKEARLAHPETSKYNKRLGFWFGETEWVPRASKAHRGTSMLPCRQPVGERMTLPFLQVVGAVNFPQVSQLDIIGILFA